MTNTERTAEAIERWDSTDARNTRVAILKSLFKKAGLETELGAVPPIHLEVMNYDKYMMTVMALAKIRELNEITQLMPV